MKICLAQTKPYTGDIGRNIQRHLEFIDQVVAQEADMIIFPELSLTAYEPKLARELAIRPGDPRLDIFQERSDEHQLIIGLGVPTVKGHHLFISMLVFQPQQDHLIYSKKYLHADEEPFFESGANFPVLDLDDHKPALAICYEISIPEHAATAFAHNATIYIASVVKFVSGLKKAFARLSEIAGNYKTPVLMANSVGTADNGICGGQSSIWNARGELVDQLNGLDEGILLFDTETGDSSALLLPLSDASNS
ncbi:MAG: carbon-nitrogen hydrolase family protein [Saprospiraceae bacterium]|nr:carbon-nitrogen hydrolase family protein [Lewinella sp.]